MQILRPSRRITRTDYSLTYEWLDSPGSGFGFPCDVNGNLIDQDDMPPEAAENYRKCTDGTFAVSGPKIQKFTSAYIDPAIGECDECGTVVSLESFTNTCQNCGADYNMSGQRLSSRRLWGEETGESPGEILSI